MFLTGNLTKLENVPIIFSFENLYESFCHNFFCFLRGSRCAEEGGALYVLFVSAEKEWALRLRKLRKSQKCKVA